MKYYPRDVDAAIEGMSELTLEQIGAYTLILDHLYARDAILPNDDVLLARILNIHAQRWRRLKRELMARGKIRITNDGLLTANGVETCRKLVSLRSVSARKAASLRWEKHRKAKEINGTAIRPAMRAGNAIKKESNSLPLLSSEDSETAAVDEGENFGAVPPHSTTATTGRPPRQTIGTGELEAIIRAKGWR